jgi:hypothetical protein
MMKKNIDHLFDEWCDEKCKCVTTEVTEMRFKIRNILVNEEKEIIKM